VEKKKIPPQTEETAKQAGTHSGAADSIKLLKHTVYIEINRTPGKSKHIRVQHISEDFRKNNFSGLVRSKADYSALRNKRKKKLRQMGHLGGSVS